MAQLVCADIAPGVDCLADLGIERNTRPVSSDEREDGPVISEALRLDLIGTAAIRLANLENQVLSR